MTTIDQLQIITGRDHHFETQLLTKSRQSHVLKNTPNDARERFTDQVSFEQWFKKGREIYWLVGPNRDLAGIFWHGPKSLPEGVTSAEPAGETFGIRLYEGYIGHGLATPFLRECLRRAARLRQTHSQSLTGFWLETDLDNQAARAVYAKLGFIEVHHDAKRATMVLSTTKLKEL
jgi:RimJ/RimL family protein N-acetyltransferase